MTHPDVNVSVKPGQRIVIHDDKGEAQAALIIDLEHRHPRQPNREPEIAVQFRTARMIRYSAQVWVHPEDGEVI